jgi:predicted dienelactone hydrolase
MNKIRGKLLAVAMSVAIVGSAPLDIEAQNVDRSPLPAPTGSHAVGRTFADIVDESRPDRDNASRHREIVVWIWYPAIASSDATPAEWMPGKWAEAFSAPRSDPRDRAAAPIPNVASVRSHSHTDAPLDSTTNRYPVLLFAPGLGTTPLDYSTLAEDVASHGYIVVGVVSPDFGRASVYSDGRVVPGHDPVELVTRGGARLTTELAIHAYEDGVHGYSKDLSVALNQLANGSLGVVNGHADLTRVGVYGHSLGGAAALQFAHDDSRVRAAFDIDGSPIWSAENGALPKPVLILSAASTSVSYDAVLTGATPGRHLRLAGTVHTFASDVRSVLGSLQGGAEARAPAGLIPPARALRITATYLEAFFNETLNGRREPLLSGASPDYPEISFERGPSRAP